METGFYLIVGLGNPGPKYAANRHNVGFMCLERLAEAHGLTFDKRQKKARVALGAMRGRRVVLAQPQTFMNDSGQAVAPLARFYRVPPERLLIVYDDLDLPSGTVRIRPGGGSGGHKGMLSITEQLNDQNFARLRIGIGRPPGQMDPAAYVLQDFSADEKLLVAETLDRAMAAVETWLVEGVEMAMSRHNSGPDCL
ncbi:MAG: aminoacyl-tRNA hydrolase [Anaerolineae bacterium]|nr:aminoacyl-tRNA hydrolase [Anaerolineae bacterium]